MVAIPSIYMMCVLLSSLSLAQPFFLSLCHLHKHNSVRIYNDIRFDAMLTIRFEFEYNEANKVTEQAHVQAKNRKKASRSIRTQTFARIFCFVCRQNIEKLLRITSTNTMCLLPKEQIRFRTRMGTPFSKIELPM